MEKRTVQKFLAFERYFMPILFMVNGIHILRRFCGPSPYDASISYGHFLANLIDDIGNAVSTSLDVLIFSEAFLTLVLPVFMIIFNFVVAMMLLFMRRSTRPPSHWREVLLPFFLQLVFLLGSFATSLPMSWNRLLVSPAFFASERFVVGSILAVVGASLSLFALVSLGRNFSISVRVADIVRSGAYRYLKHPMYLGQILTAGGIAMVYPSQIFLALFAVLVPLQWARARMENRALIVSMSGCHRL